MQSKGFTKPGFSFVQQARGHSVRSARCMTDVGMWNSPDLHLHIFGAKCFGACKCFFPVYEIDVHPPNPPPVSRAPIKPGNSSASITIVSASAQLASKSPLYSSALQPSVFRVHSDRDESGLQ
jgi:hypothetical protein